MPSWGVDLGVRAQGTGLAVAALALLGIGCVLWRGYEELRKLQGPQVREALRPGRVCRAVPRDVSSGGAGESGRSGVAVPVAERDVGNKWDGRMQALLEEALLLAVTAHRGQKDKGGAPYLLHPFRMMLSLGEPAEMIAAVLHDTVEDGGLTLEELRHRGFPDEVVCALDALTRRPGESYADYLGRVRENPIAMRVKVADLEDNLDESRIPNPTDRDRERWEKYRRALVELVEGAGRFTGMAQACPGGRRQVCVVEEGIADGEGTWQTRAG